VVDCLIHVDSDSITSISETLEIGVMDSGCVVVASIRERSERFTGDERSKTARIRGFLVQI